MLQLVEDSCNIFIIFCCPFSFDKLFLIIMVDSHENVKQSKIHRDAKSLLLDC